MQFSFLLKICYMLAAIANEIVVLNINESAVECYSHFEKEQRTQQQILWMFASLLQWPRPKFRLQMSVITMEFFKTILQTRENLMAAHMRGNAVKVFKIFIFSILIFISILFDLIFFFLT